MLIESTLCMNIAHVWCLFYNVWSMLIIAFIMIPSPFQYNEGTKNHHWLILKAFDNFLKCCCFSVGESPQSRVKCRWEDRGKLCWEIFIWSEGSLCLPPLPSPHSAPPNPPTPPPPPAPPPNPPPPPPAPPPAAHLKEELVLRSPRIPSLLQSTSSLNSSSTMGNEVTMALYW